MKNTLIQVIRVICFILISIGLYPFIQLVLWLFSGDLDAGIFVFALESILLFILPILVVIFVHPVPKMAEGIPPAELSAQIAAVRKKQRKFSLALIAGTTWLGLLFFSLMTLFFTGLAGSNGRDVYILPLALFLTMLFLPPVVGFYILIRNIINRHNKAAEQKTATQGVVAVPWVLILIGVAITFLFIWVAVSAFLNPHP